MKLIASLICRKRFKIQARIKRWFQAKRRQKMKKVILILMAVLFVLGQISCAQSTAKPDTMTFSGKVDSIAAPDPDRGMPEGSLIVIGSNGDAKNFTLTAKTRFIDKKGSPMAGDDIELGDKVTVEYSTGDSGNIAESMTLVP